MDATNYRNDPKPLAEMVAEYMGRLNVKPDDRRDILAMLAPLGAKREAGQFHRDHSLRVGLLAAEMAEVVDLSATPMFFAGLLHDVGKALVPACTLSATAAWSETDAQAMEQHVLDGFRMLRDRFDFTGQVILWHHRFQRNGYPSKLPLPTFPASWKTLLLAQQYGQLLMVADVFDAFHRVNSATGGKALTPEEIRAKMFALHPELLGDLVPRLYRAGVLR